MSSIPIPGKLYFSDFADDVLEYEVYDKDKLVGTYRGLTNSDEGGQLIHFLISEKPDISVGNILRTKDGLESFSVRRIEYDRYNGKPELMKAYI